MFKTTIVICAAVVIFAIGFAAGASTAHAQDTGKLQIWGGADPGKSVYTDVYVPRVIDVLGQNALAGYQWGGPTQGTVDNAARVTDNPTHLAVGQLDILRSLAGQPREGGAPYAFTILAQDIGPECLWLVTNLPGYNTWGDFLGNTWQATVATGGELSGSFGTWKYLSSLYPVLGEAYVNNVGDAGKIIEAVKSGAATHGFFVMRPDPQSATFKAINDAKMSIVPVVDFGLEGEYAFTDLKVANGGFFSDAKTVTTACTSVALITGDPNNVALSPRDKKRLEATITRISALPADQLRPNISSWQDMFDSMKAAAGDKAREMMEASKTALEGIIASK